MEVKLKYEVVEPFVKNLVKARGKDPETFLHPDKTNLAHPTSLAGMTKAAYYVQKHAGHKAATIVDSDCDGFCASAILLNYFKELFPNWEIDYYVHERKGHGLSDIVEDVDLTEYQLIFLPDAGSNDDIYFNDLSFVDFIVLDHHERTNEAQLPDNVAIVNNQLSPDYDNKALSGAGVTWQFCRYLDELYETDFAWQFIDLAATAIIGDIMDITTPENRYIITEGLANYSNTFLCRLRDAAAFKLGPTLTPTGVAFYIVPQINAMCRMGSIDEKKRMFLSFIDPFTQVECHKRGVAAGTMVDVVIESVRECTNAKSRQKRLQDNMASLCDQQIMENDLLSNKIVVITLDENFDDMPSEMNGVTATKVANETGHPTLIGRINDEGMLRGSIRGLSTVNMPPFKDFLQSSGFFEFVEGHQNAAGFSLPYKKLDKFLDWANEQLKDVDLNTKTWNVDFQFSPNSSDLSQVIYDLDSVQNLWGQGFPEPLISIPNLRVNRSEISVMGKDSDTVKIYVNGIAFMFFKRTQQQVKDILKYPRAVFNIVGKANLNRFGGRTTPQIFVEDYEAREDLGF